MSRPLASITLGEMLAHDSEEVRRHAQGAFKSLLRDEQRLMKDQDMRLKNPKPQDPKCRKCGLWWTKGTREATRDFVYTDICISCNKR